MSHVLYIFGWNLLIATVMALAVWLVCRTPFFRRRPAVCHILWLLVLLKLVLLPTSSTSVWAWGANPEPAVSCACGGSTCACSGLIAAEAQSNATQANGALTVFSLYNLIPILGVSLLGTCVLWFIAARRLFYVRRLLKGGAVRSGRATELLRQVSRKFKLRASMKLRIVDAPISPLLWAVPGNRSIILPRQLADSFDSNGLRSIFAHELAHYVRRDHWVSLLAWIVATLCWWNPLVWIARRQLSAAAEASCDALALDQLHGSRKSYAQTLLTVVDSVTPPQRAAFGIAFAESISLRRRFEMIADTNVKGSTSRSGWFVLAVAGFMLLIVPVHAQENSNSVAVSSSPPVEGANELPTDIRSIEFSAVCCPS